MQTEGRLRELREEWHERDDEVRRRQILTEAIALNGELREAVRTRLGRIERFLQDLDHKAVRYRARLAEIVASGD